MHRLGKAPATYDSRDLQFAHYRTGKLPAHPKTFGHEKFVGAKAWGMLGNGPDDTVAPGFQGAGDCVWAGAGHETMVWTAEAGKPVTFTGRNAIADYSAATGYEIGNDSTDNGTDVRAALKYRQKIGIVDAKGKRHKIGAYVALEPGNLDYLREALYIFGIVGTGIAFPISAMDQLNAGRIWSVAHGARNDGGHYIPVVAQRTHVECVTWGQIQPMTDGFYAAYNDEAYIILSEEMLVAGKTLEGFDLAALQVDLAALKK